MAFGKVPSKVTVQERITALLEAAYSEAQRKLSHRDEGILQFTDEDWEIVGDRRAYEFDGHLVDDQSTVVFYKDRPTDASIRLARHCSPRSHVSLRVQGRRFAIVRSGLRPGMAARFYP